MLKLSEFWSARAHSEDFTLTRMGFMTVRLRLLTCMLMVGLNIALICCISVCAIRTSTSLFFISGLDCKASCCASGKGYTVVGTGKFPGTVTAKSIDVGKNNNCFRITVFSLKLLVARMRL